MILSQISKQFEVPLDYTETPNFPNIANLTCHTPIRLIPIDVECSDKHAQHTGSHDICPDWSW